MRHAATRLTNVFERVPVVNSQQPDCEHASMPDMKFVVLLILSSIAVTSSPAAGQTIPSPFAFVEYSKEWAVFLGKSDINPGLLGLGPQSGTMGGGRYSAAFGGAMSVDVAGTLFASRRDVLDVSRPEDDRVLGSNDIDIFLLDVRLRLNLTGARTWHGLQPFIVFGGGLALPFSVNRDIEIVAFMPGNEWYSFGTRFTGSFAAGTSFHVSSKLSIRLDGVMNLWKITTPIGWLTTDADPLGENPQGEWVSAKSITLGASWRR